MHHGPVLGSTVCVWKMLQIPSLYQRLLGCFHQHRIALNEEMYVMTMKNNKQNIGYHGQTIDNDDDSNIDKENYDWKMSITTKTVEHVQNVQL